MRKYKQEKVHTNLSETETIVLLQYSKDFALLILFRAY